MITIKDVARKCGVSISTVSNVLNDVPTVNKAIRQRVLKVVRELNYKPNRIAQSLVSGYTETLAFILPDISNPFFPELIRGATDRATMSGYDLFLGNIVKNSREIEYIRHFVSLGIDGLIIATSEYEEYTQEEIDQITSLSIPIVMVDRDLKGLERDLVILDNIQCAQTLMNHLINLGHKRIGMILGPLHTLTAYERLEGGKRALQEHGLFKNELVKVGDFSLESGFRTMQTFFTDGIEVDAIFCVNDVIAIGAIKAIEQAGYRVPENIAVAGFDDLFISSLIKPTLTTIRQPTYEIGSIAVNLIIERINGTATSLPRKVILPGELIVRESTVKSNSTSS